MTDRLATETRTVQNHAVHATKFIEQNLRPNCFTTDVSSADI